MELLTLDSNSRLSSWMTIPGNDILDQPLEPLKKSRSKLQKSKKKRKKKSSTNIIKPKLEDPVVNDPVDTKITESDRLEIQIMFDKIIRPTQNDSYEVQLVYLRAEALNFEVQDGIWLNGIVAAKRQMLEFGCKMLIEIGKSNPCKNKPQIYWAAAP